MYFQAECSRSLLMAAPLRPKYSKYALLISKVKDSDKSCRRANRNTRSMFTCSPRCASRSEMRSASEQVENEWSATDSTSCNDIPCVIHPLLGIDFILGKLSTNG